MQVFPDTVLVCLPLYPLHFTPEHLSGPKVGVGFGFTTGGFGLVGLGLVGLT
jgi:hypothetical protein